MQSNFGLSWIRKRLTLSSSEKRALAAYAAGHLVLHGDVLYLGTGTTLTELMTQLILRQAREQSLLDLLIVTNSMQVVAVSRPDEDPPREGAGSNVDDARLTICRETQLILLGGKMNASLDSLNGPLAVRGINDKSYSPSTVFFGCRGLNCAEDLLVYYQFEEELSVQEAYASRPTTRRVLMCDHTKFGTTVGCKANITAKSLLRDAAECIILTTQPSDTPMRKALDAQIASLRHLCEGLADDESLNGKELALWLIDKEGNRHVAVSLAEIRGNSPSNPSLERPRSATANGIVGRPTRAVKT